MVPNYLLKFALDEFPSFVPKIFWKNGSALKWGKHQNYIDSQLAPEGIFCKLDIEISLFGFNTTR